MLFQAAAWLVALPLGAAAPSTQRPVQLGSHGKDLRIEAVNGQRDRPLQGRFLHITGQCPSRACHDLLLMCSDLHPDPFYKIYSSTAAKSTCHRGKGPAGSYGAETTSCDSPISLLNATFDWIAANVEDRIDFIIWTGDSARHDNDERIPRTEEQVTSLNRLCVEKFSETFGARRGVPVVPTFGNNDILPHNIFTPGPNRWTKKYLEVWEPFIPESQRHTFVTGGWFYVEVVPDRLAVFSLNTLYFFDSNAAVDGCANPSEPGYQQFTWLRIQLQFMRNRGMKAIMMGHVPPARTRSKQSWDETCWQKYTLWMHQYRDVVVGSVYGHMNTDHFMLQDFNEFDIVRSRDGNVKQRRAGIDDGLSTWAVGDYLNELRSGWSSLPSPPKGGVGSTNRKERDRAGRKDKFNKKIGGPWGERFSMSLVSPSVVPSYFPTLRIIEYNASGLDAVIFPREAVPSLGEDDIHDRSLRSEDSGDEYADLDTEIVTQKGKRERRHKKGKHSKERRFKVPKGPSKSSPPGPAYSPQSFTWLGYQQFFANLTMINNDFNDEGSSTVLEAKGRWREGKHSNGKSPQKGSKPKAFGFQLEYDTRNDSVYSLKDMTVRSYIGLAARIGKYKPSKKDRLKAYAGNPMDAEAGEGLRNDDDRHDGKPEGEADTGSASSKHKKKHKRRRAINKVWFTFVQRAFVGSRDEKDLHKEFGRREVKATAMASVVEVDDFFMDQEEL